MSLIGGKYHWSHQAYCQWANTESSLQGEECYMLEHFTVKNRCYVCVLYVCCWFCCWCLFVNVIHCVLIKGMYVGENIIKKCVGYFGVTIVS